MNKKTPKNEKDQVIIVSLFIILIALSFVVGYYSHNFLTPEQKEQTQTITSQDIDNFGSSFTYYINVLSKLQGYSSSLHYKGHMLDKYGNIYLFYGDAVRTTNVSVSNNFSLISFSYATVDSIKKQVSELVKEDSNKKIVMGLYLDGCNDSDQLVDNAIELKQLINNSEISIIYKIYNQSQLIDKLNLSNNSNLSSYCLVLNNVSYCSPYGKDYVLFAGRAMAVKDVYGFDIWNKFRKDYCPSCEISYIDYETIDPIISKYLSKAQIYTSLNIQTPAFFVNGDRYEGILSLNTMKDFVCSKYLVSPEWCSLDLPTNEVKTCQ